MGKISKGILGGFSGKVGPTIGASWKGISYMRGIPDSVANPNTEGQQAQRSKMSACVAVAKDLLAIAIQPLWGLFAVKMSEFNAFVKYNIANFDTDGVVDYSLFVPFKGTLLGAASAEGTADVSANQLVVTWANNSGTADALASDEAVIVYHNTTTNKWGADIGSVVRSAGTKTISLTGMVVDGDINVYLGFRRPNGSKVSNPSYVQVLPVA